MVLAAHHLGMAPNDSYGFWVLVTGLTWAGLAIACGDSGSGAGGTGGDGNSPSQGGGGQTSGGGGAGGSMGSFTTGGNAPMGPFFPDEPILDEGAPANAPELFGEPGSGEVAGGPCLVEPELGSLLPNNWLRPRFRYLASGGQNLFEIRLHAESEPNDMVVYTTQPSWTMDKPTWENIAPNVTDEPITVTIRGAVFNGSTLDSGPSIGSSGDITIAPVGAGGTIVYWTTSGNSALKGFKVGDESVVSALTPPQVQMNTTNNAEVTCVGCHTSTPDGLYASFVAQGPWSNAVASIEAENVGQEPPFFGAGAREFLQSATELGIHTYSLGHWQAGDHVMVTPSGVNDASRLLWVDLEAATNAEGTSWGVIARTGDTHGVGSPSWSHDGTSIVYVSTNAQTTGRLDNGIGDLYTVPYANRAGGAATPLPGASSPDFAEYYPAYAPDDDLIVFNRIPDGQNMYDAVNAELFAIPATGGTAVRLAANDPPACTGKVSPGITNSWPKWSPEAQTVGSKTHYWLIFSSRRSGGNPQLYVTGLVKEGDTLTSYPALYLWNQPAEESNHTPAWDVFDIPPVPPPT